MWKHLVLLSLLLVIINPAFAEEYQVHIEADTDWFVVCMNASILEELPRPPVMLTNIQPIQELYIGHGRLICSGTYQQNNDYEADYTVVSSMDVLNIATMKGLLGTITIEIYHDSTTLIATFTNSQTTGQWNYEEFTVNLSGVDDYQSHLPQQGVLSQNYPNPFNPSTTISYTVQVPALTQLTIYNNLGQVIRILVEEYTSPGDYEVTWDGITDWGSRASSGAYYYQLKVGDYTSAKKMILLK